MLTALVQITSRSYVDSKGFTSSLCIFVLHVSRRNVKAESSFTICLHRGDGRRQRGRRTEKLRRLESSSVISPDSHHTNQHTHVIDLLRSVHLDLLPSMAVCLYCYLSVIYLRLEKNFKWITQFYSMSKVISY